MDEQYQLSAQVQRIGRDEAILKLGGQTFSWPVANLPEDVQEGDDVHLRLISKQTEQEEHHERARLILTEILGGRT